MQTPKGSEDQMQALLCIRAEIRMATSSMTSVPKPLKFLREHFDELESCYGNLATSSPSKKLLADVLSVLAMAVDDKTERKCLNYRLQGSQEKVSSFGHPYIRCVGCNVIFSFKESVGGRSSHAVDNKAETVIPYDDL